MSRSRGKSLLVSWISRTRRGGENSPLLAPWMSRSREEEGKNPSSRCGCRDREGRVSSHRGYQEQGEEERVLPLLVPWMSRSKLKTPSITSRCEKRGGHRACG